MKKKSVRKKGQSAIEYIVLATTITIVVLVGFDGERGMLIQARNMAEGMFNQALRGIMGTPSTDAVRTFVDSGTAFFGYP